MGSSKLYPELDLKTESIGNDGEVVRKSKLMTFLAQYSTVWNGLRLSFALICFAWFSYNAITIINQYKQYNTIVMLQYELPNQTDLPAFTICVNSIVFSEDLRAKYKDYEELDPDDVALDKALTKLTAFEIFNMSIGLGSLVKDCYFKQESIRDSNSSLPEIKCENISDVIPSIYEGRKCFTFFSQMNTTDKENMNIKMEYDRNPLIHLEISYDNNNWPVGRIQNATIIVAVHSPNMIPTTLDMGFIRIFPQRFYDLRFNKHIAYLKPPPYKTNCRSYYRTNPKGERSRGDCINNCIKKETYSSSNCAIYYGIITEDLLCEGEKICQKRSGNYKNYTIARKKCLNYCQLSCIEETYEVIYAQEYYNNSDDNNSIIEITSHSMPYTFIYHKEALGEEEFIGTLGGHAHIWLGLSAIKLFNYIIHFINRFNHVY